MTDFAWFAALLILAAILDVGLMAGLRQLYRLAPPKVRAGRAVYLSGRYSPVLSWLRQWVPAIRQRPPQEIADAPAATEQSAPFQPSSQAVESEPSPEDEERESPLQLPPVDGESAGAERGKRWYQGRWVEWGVIVLAVTVYCAGILDLGAPTRLPGNEAEVFQMLDWTLVNSLAEYGKFPLWNPYLQTGVPFVADPALHVYNPVVTLPVLLLGVPAGFKLGIYFSFLIGALGMWQLGETLGLGSAARLWMALMYAFAGQPAARFFQGQYQFVLGFAYIPWVVGGVLALAALPPTFPPGRAGSRAVLQAALGLALLFFSGNPYYSFYILLATALLLLVALPVFQRRPPFLRLSWHLLRSALCAGLLTLGLVAIQLLPTAESWLRLSQDHTLAGSQTLTQVFLDYISKDSFRPDAYDILPAREEFYAYIGLAPFLALSLLPLVSWKRHWRPLAFFLLLLALVGVWISLDAMPWQAAFLEAPFLLHFRHLLRILVFGSFALLALAGLGLDALWKAFNRLLQHPWAAKQPPQAARALPPCLPRIVRSGAYAGLGILGVFMLFSVLDVFNTHQPLLQTQAVYQPAYQVQGWVRQLDTSAVYVRHTPNNAWQEATLANRLRFIDVWYYFTDIRRQDGALNRRPVQAQPHYLTQSVTEPAPQGGVLLQTLADTHIYRLPESLPMAFLVRQDVLAQETNQPLQASEVTPVLPFFSSSGRAVLMADGQSGQLLVLLMANYPGWQVAMDGVVQPLLNVGGYLAVAAEPGVHEYTFTYQPPLFYVGLAISLVAAVVTAVLLRRALQGSRAALIVRWQAGLVAFRQAQARLGAWWCAHQPLALAEQGLLSGVPAAPPPGLPAWQRRLYRWRLAGRGLFLTLRRAIPLPMALFILGLLVYLLTRLVGLADWPIYFFTDEAVQTVMAEDFLQNGLRNYSGEILPTYFSKDPTYNLSSVSVYLQVLPLVIFGKSVFVTRAVSVLVATFGAVMVGLTLRDIFKLRTWWSGVLLLSVVPAWFLHSRTAFETVEMTAFYAAFLYFYLRYRTLNPRALYPALVFGALVFYTYSPGQLIILVSGVFLLFSDLRYHWQQRRVALRGLLLLAVLVLPYLRHYLAHPEATLQHLSTRAPFWLEDIPLVEKLQHYFQTYLAALDPRYWFLPNQVDLDRHLMQGYGHLSLWMLPLVALGLGVSLSRLRSPAHRAVLLALLAAPTGSALVSVGITRLLVLVIPAVLLMSIGLGQALEWLVSLGGWLLGRLQRGVLPQAAAVGRVHTALALLLVGGLCAVNFAMLRDARLNGPLWYQDYTLAGMQYGARQLFRAVQDYYTANPGVQLIVSPSWTNGADAVVEFFLPQGAPVRLGSVEGHIFQRLPLDDSTVFVAIPTEMDKLQASGKFAEVRIEQVLEYPNGEPGFYFIRLRYVDNIDAILEAERESRRALLEADLLVDGQPVLVRYPMLDMGSIDLLFDGNLNSVARTLEANPFVIDLAFSAARPVRGVSLVLGSAYLQVRASLTVAGVPEPVVFEAFFHGSVAEPELVLDFGRTLLAEAMRLEVLAPGIAEPVNVHVWEVTLQPAVDGPP